MKKPRSAQEMFIGKYAKDKYLKRVVDQIFKETDRKNERSAELVRSIADDVGALEEHYKVQGFSAATLDQQTARAFMRDTIALQADTDISYDPHKYFIHMLTGMLTEPGFVGALTGMLMHGNQVTTDVSSFSSALERRVGDMTKEMFGYHPNTREFRKAVSFITSGGTEANHLSLLVGRNKSYLRQEGVDIQSEGIDGVINAGKYRTPKIIVPASAHYSFKRIANALGIGESNIIYIPANLQGQMDTDKLEETLKDFDTKKNKLVSIVGVFGSTETGAVDDLETILRLVEGFEKETGEAVWKHIDAAYGGPCIVTERFADVQEFFTKYDSVTFDPHKQLWVPYGAGAVMFKDALDLRTVSTDAPYIGNTDLDKLDDKKFVDELYQHLGGVKLIGSQSTQGPIATYLTLKCFGKEGIRQVIEGTYEVAQYLAHKLSEQKLANGRIEVFNENPEMNLVNWRFIPQKYECLDKRAYHETQASSPDELPQVMKELNELNKGLYDYFAGNTEFLISHTTLQTFNMQVQRAVIMNPHTTCEDIDRFVAAYVQKVAQIE